MTRFTKGDHVTFTASDGRIIKGVDLTARGLEGGIQKSITCYEDPHELSH